MGRPANRVAVHVSIVSFACRWRSAGRRTSRLAELGRKASSDSPQAGSIDGGGRDEQLKDFLLELASEVLPWRRRLEI
jgi:hypothetical protein